MATSWIYLPSTIRQKVDTMSEVRAAVETRFRTQLAEMDRATYEDFVVDKTAELEQMIAELTASTEHQVIADWEQSMGRAADYLERMGLHNQARSAAQELVLEQQLWEGYQAAEDQESPQDQEPPVQLLPAMERWKRPEASEAEPEIERLTARVWPTETTEFLGLAGDLLQARSEDNLPLPTGPDDPLTPELGALVREYQGQLDAAVAELRARQS